MKKQNKKLYWILGGILLLLILSNKQQTLFSTYDAKKIEQSVISIKFFDALGNEIIIDQPTQVSFIEEFLSKLFSGDLFSFIVPESGNPIGGITSFQVIVTVLNNFPATGIFVWDSLSPTEAGSLDGVICNGTGGTDICGSATKLIGANQSRSFTTAITPMSYLLSRSQPVLFTTKVNGTLSGSTSSVSVQKAMGFYTHTIFRTNINTGNCSNYALPGNFWINYDYGGNGFLESFESFGYNGGITGAFDCDQANPSPPHFITAGGCYGYYESTTDRVSVCTGPGMGGVTPISEGPIIYNKANSNICANGDPEYPSCLNQNPTQPYTQNHQETYTIIPNTPPTGYITYLNMNGNTQDSSGNLLHGTITNNMSAVNCTAPGHNGIGQGCKFTSNGGITLPVSTFYNEPFGNGLSISMWINSTFDGQTQLVLATKGCHTTSGAEYMWYLNNGTNSMGLDDRQCKNSGNEAQTATLDNMINKGEWQHVVMTWIDSGQANVGKTNYTLYINGQQASFFSRTTPVQSLCSLFQMVLGNRLDYTSRPFRGTMDEVKIWNREINSTEVSLLYNYERTN